MNHGAFGIIMACVLAASVVNAQVDGDAAFAYQGRVKVQGQPFDGTGQFKFAVVDTSGTTTLWSNDSTGTAAEEPNASISLPVQDGIFNVIVGDTSAGMAPINPTIFSSPTPRKLRVWFSDGTHGFQQLLPDHTLLNLNLIAVTTGEKDFTIYVRHSDGNNADNGLTTETAKKTIQAAIDVLPDRVKSNVTIDVEPGLYREEVIISGITVPQGKLVTLLGDKTWTPSAGGSPNVQISGMNTSGTRVRESGLRCLSSTRILCKGFGVSGTSKFGINTDFSSCEFVNCMVSDTLNNGFIIGASCYVTLRSCLAIACQGTGYRVGGQTSVLMYGCTAANNSFAGLLIDSHCQVSIFETSVFRDNADSQIWIGGASILDCHVPVQVVNTHGSISKRGISNGWMSMIKGYSVIQYSGLLSPTYLETRGATKWD